MTEMLEKTEINKRSIGQQVYVVTNYGGWFGTVVDVVDAENFLIKNANGKISSVSIFDIRNPDNPE